MSATRQLSGFHAIISRLRARPESVHTIYVAASRRDRRARELIERAGVAGLGPSAGRAGTLAALSRNAHHPGVVARVGAAGARPPRPAVPHALVLPGSLALLP